MAEATTAVETTAPAAAPDNAAQGQTGTTTAPAASATPEDKPERTFTQKELDDILERRLGKERRRREELQRRLAVTEELALKGRPSSETAKPSSEQQAGAEPKRDDYDSYEAYLEARADWRADRRVEERLAKQREEEQRNRTATEQQQLERSFREHAAKAAQKLEDFEDVISSSQAMITQAMSEALMSAGEIGPEILYHLAKNPDESQRIATLPASRQAAEIGKLEVKLAASPAPEAKKSSAAPPPIKPVTGRSPSTDDEPDPKDTRAWIAWRERQLLARRRGTQP